MSYLGSYDPRLLRASDEDRERVLRLLGQALTTGRLSPDEHAERVGRALGARTEGELNVLTWDLAPPPPAIAPAWPPTPSPWAPSVYWASPGYPAATRPRRTNALALVSFCVSLVGVVLAPYLLGGLFAVLVGLRARGELARRPGEEEGQGLAVAGIVIGVIGVLLGTVILAHRLV